MLHKRTQKNTQPFCSYSRTLSMRILPVCWAACKHGAFQCLLSGPQPYWSSTTTSRALSIVSHPPAVAYRQMHKEFNRVDLMREQRRTGEGVNAMDLLSSPPQPIGQIRCIDRGQWGVVLVPWLLSRELQMGQARVKCQLWVNNVNMCKTVSLFFFLFCFFHEHLQENGFSSSGINYEKIQFAVVLFVKKKKKKRFTSK